MLPHDLLLKSMCIRCRPRQEFLRVMSRVCRRDPLGSGARSSHQSARHEHINMFRGSHPAPHGTLLCLAHVMRLHFTLPARLAVSAMSSLVCSSGVPTRTRLNSWCLCTHDAMRSE
ncbi:hypothetical protein BV20DRAFT_194248 [Pilatotrama ljubarskyi]|nr:hypothetical protein BV20DRAFT_194248 [Pilatotrama ljubarskyi]